MNSAPVISIFATLPTEPEWERRHERCKTRKEAADCIRDARAKGGFNINVFAPWAKKRAANEKLSHAAESERGNGNKTL